MTESYEQLRDSATGEAGAAWKAADREEANLRTLYRTLKEDPRYTPEHKAEQAWAAYEAAKEKIAEGKAKARESLQKQARSGERFSIPMPEGEHLVPSDTSKLLASQNEASRIVRKLDRLEGSAGPFKRKPAEVLKEEYKRGLQIGGVQGGAICRGVLEAADELGVDKDQVVDDFRRPSHRNALSDAERSLMLTQHISKQVPEPPFPNPRLQRVKAAGRVGSYGGVKRHSFHADRRPPQQPSVGHRGSSKALVVGVRPLARSTSRGGVLSSGARRRGPYGLRATASRA